MSEPLSMPVFRRTSWRSRLASFESRVLGALGDRVRRAAHAPTFRRNLLVASCFLACALGTGAYFAFRATPKPDYATGDLDDLFNYTLLTDDFNSLSVDERMRLIAQLIQRLRGMSAQESLLLASFAAGVEGEARAQIERNGSRLAIDVWDTYAKDYAKTPESEREAYLERSFVEFSKMMEGLAGRPREVSDEDRVREVRQQADRDLKTFKDPEQRPDNEGLANFLSMMNDKVASRATPQERARGQQMLRDMMRHFRGQDIATGKPLPPGTPGGG